MLANFSDVYEFQDYRLEIKERRLTRSGQAVHLRGKVFDTLAVLVANQGKLIRKDELLKAVWPDTVVEDNNLDHNISQLRKTLGDLPDGKKIIETIPRQGYRFAADVREVTSQASPISIDAQAIPEQKIQFFTTHDGVRIAYSVAGSGPPLVKAANWLNHLDFEWQSPIWRHWIPVLTAQHTLIRYDERGNGLSDWNISDFSFEAWIQDFDELIETLGLKKFSLLGISQGGAVAMAYAARYPERVEKLVLYGSFARGWMHRGSEEVERRNALLTLVKLGWGTENPAFRQMWTSIFMPDATPEQANWFNELQQVTTSPENAVELLKAGGRINIVDLLPNVRCPTIIFHSRNESAVPFKEGHLIASRIPGSRLVELPSRNHLVIPQEPAWEIFVRELNSFLSPSL
jgi:DNA-binding winged helix-turn-helix (wHTH) protein/pimeloyl-ACP methyl ester carboxylesterase